MYRNIHILQHVSTLTYITGPQRPRDEAGPIIRWGRAAVYRAKSFMLTNRSRACSQAQNISPRIDIFSAKSAVCAYFLKGKARRSRWQEKYETWLVKVRHVVMRLLNFVWHLSGTPLVPQNRERISKARIIASSEHCLMIEMLSLIDVDWSSWSLMHPAWVAWNNYRSRRQAVETYYVTTLDQRQNNSTELGRASDPHHQLITYLSTRLFSYT